jgi:ParB-like chromosome segregation protein Spo0J
MDSHHDDLTAQLLDSKIRENLSFDDDAIQKIMDDIDKYGKHDQWYKVDDATYERLFG